MGPGETPRFAVPPESSDAVLALAAAGTVGMVHGYFGIDDLVITGSSSVNAVIDELPTDRRSLRSHPAIAG